MAEMLRRLSTVMGWTIDAEDGSIGSVDDFYFDEEAWAIRWIVIDTGGWLSGRQVLLPPSAVADTEPLAGALRVRLTRQQVKDSPDAATDRPVSRQMETRIYDHYGWPPYWAMPTGALVPPLAAPAPVLARAGSKPGLPPEPAGDSSLHSASEIIGSYSIAARDGDIGHVEDFLADEHDWSIRYMMIDTRNWWPGKKVLVSPSWIDDVSWSEGAVRVRLDREQVRGSPEFDPSGPVPREYEERLHRHYGLAGYWM